MFAVFDLSDGVEESLSLGERVEGYFTRWDAGWYRTIATYGYDFEHGYKENGQSVFVFYPLLPYLMRALSSAFGISPIAAGILLSNLCFGLAIPLFYRFCRLRGASERVGFYAVSLLAFCPQNFVFSAAYTESLFLFLSLATLVAFESRKTAVASVSAALLSASRSNGLILGVYFLCSVIRGIVIGIRSGRKIDELVDRNAQALWIGAVLPVGLFSFWWLCFASTGDAFAQSHGLVEGWGWRFDWFWSSWIRWTMDGTFLDRYWLFSSAFFFICSFLLLKRKLYDDFAYCVLNFLLFYSGSVSNAMLRYAIVVFPVYLGISLFLENKPRRFAILMLLFVAANIVLAYYWFDRNPMTI